MGWMGRCWNMLRGRSLNREIEEELQFHLTSRAEDNAARGMRPAEAEQDARRRFGSKTLVLESTREANIAIAVEDLFQDIRFAARLFRRWQAFTALVVLLIGLGIGASTAMFSLLMHVVFPVNGFENSPRLVFLGRFNKMGGDFLERMSYLDLSDIRSESRSFERMSVYRFALLDVNATGEPESIRGLAVDSDWLPAKNVVSQLGIVGLDISKPVLELMPELRRPAGVVVAARKTPAPYTGPLLESGDVIYSVNRRVVNGVTQLQQTLNGMKTGDPVVLLVERSGHLIYVPLQLD